ncbi:MAG: hypothetical protein WC148_05025 [Bacilli bacterium]|jgi:hypothetical protein
MSITIFYFINVIFLTICSSFFVGTKGMYIRRTIVNIPLSLFNDAVIPINRNEEIDPHFDLYRVEENVNNYLIKSLKNSCDKYLIDFFPYKEEIVDDKTNYYIDLSDEIKNIQIHFNCNYFVTFNIDTYVRVSINQKGVIKDEF